MSFVVDGPAGWPARCCVHDIRQSEALGTVQVPFGCDCCCGIRETDELPVALLNFGAKRGLFVTTDRLSPQSKREYLGDSSGFELEFWDGVQLIDHVHARGA